MEYLGLKDSDKCISTPSDDFSDAQIQQIEQLGKLLSVRISSNHKTSPPLVSDDVYICTSTSVSSSSPIVLPTGCPIGKKIIVKSVGANGYVQSRYNVSFRNEQIDFRSECFKIRQKFRVYRDNVWMDDGLLTN